jgi:hypothetical protein
VVPPQLVTFLNLHLREFRGGDFAQFLIENWYAGVPGGSPWYDWLREIPCGRLVGLFRNGWGARHFGIITNRMRIERFGGVYVLVRELERGFETPDWVWPDYISRRTIWTTTEEIPVLV